MKWDKETRRKLAKEIRRVSLLIQEKEFAGSESWPDMVRNTDRKIMDKLEPLGFERANKDWEIEEHDQLGKGFNVYRDSTTHLWFETSQGRIVRIEKTIAEKLLVLGIP